MLLKHPRGVWGAVVLKYPRGVRGVVFLEYPRVVWGWGVWGVVKVP